LTLLEEECIRRIAEAKAIPVESVALDSTLESLAVDSLDRVTLSFDLEEEHGVEIPEAQLHQIQTVGDIALAIERALAKKQAVATKSAGAA
jgi:acyl carrier protein